MFLALKLLGKTVEFVQVDGEDHGVADYKKTSRMAEHHLCLVRQYLKDEPHGGDALYPGKAFIKKDEMKQVYRFRQLEQKRAFRFLFCISTTPFSGLQLLWILLMSTDKVKNRIVSFFLYSLHFLLKCVNETDAFKITNRKRLGSPL